MTATERAVELVHVPPAKGVTCTKVVGRPGGPVIFVRWRERG